MDPFDRLEHDIRQAMRRSRPRTSAGRRAQRARHSALALAATGALLLGGGAVAGVQLVPTGPVTPKSPAVDARAHFGLLRRPAEPKDHLPTSRNGNRERAAADDITRLAYAAGATNVFVVAKRDGRLCLVYRDAAIGAVACTATAQAARAASPLELAMNREGGAQVFIVVPDGIDHVEVTTSAGTHHTVRARANLTVLPRGASSVEWRDRDGVRHAWRNLSPSLPR